MYHTVMFSHKQYTNGATAEFLRGEESVHTSKRSKPSAEEIPNRKCDDTVNPKPLPQTSNFKPQSRNLKPYILNTKTLDMLKTVRSATQESLQRNCWLLRWDGRLAPAWRYPWEGEGGGGGYRIASEDARSFRQILTFLLCQNKLSSSSFQHFA